VLSQLRNRGVAADGLNRYRASPGRQPVLLLGYGRAPESALRSAVRVLADVVARAPN
jgi:DNA-binding transcriptional MocR family regulator